MVRWISHLPARPGVAPCSQYSPLPTSPWGEINVMQYVPVAEGFKIYLANHYNFVMATR